MYIRVRTDTLLLNRWIYLVAWLIRLIIYWSRYKQNKHFLLLSFVSELIALELLAKTNSLIYFLETLQ